LPQIQQISQIVVFLVNGVEMNFTTDFLVLFLPQIQQISLDRCVLSERSRDELYHRFFGIIFATDSTDFTDRCVV